MTPQCKPRPAVLGRAHARPERRNLGGCPVPAHIIGSVERRGGLRSHMHADGWSWTAGVLTCANSSRHWPSVLVVHANAAQPVKIDQKQLPNCVGSLAHSKGELVLVFPPDHLRWLPCMLRKQCSAVWILDGRTPEGQKSGSSLVSRPGSRPTRRRSRSPILHAAGRTLQCVHQRQTPVTSCSFILVHTAHML